MNKRSQSSDCPSADNQFQGAQAELLLSSYHRWTGQHLVPVGDTGTARYQALYNADFGVVSHNTESDPIFNYANKTALELFEMDWTTLTSLPSRKSAEPVNRAEREEMMRKATANGYVEGYSGVRISSTGRRFRIEDAMIWNLLDAEGHYRGQAAVFRRWTLL